MRPAHQPDKENPLPDSLREACGFFWVLGTGGITEMEKVVRTGGVTINLAINLRKLRELSHEGKVLWLGDSDATSAAQLCPWRPSGSRKNG
jgi:hypothetical protein